MTIRKVNLVENEQHIEVKLSPTELESLQQNSSFLSKMNEYIHEFIKSNKSYMIIEE
jgi:hypothetical protein